MKKFNNPIVLAVIISAAVTVSGFFLYHFLFKEKIAYVRTGIFIQDYQGMKDANAQLDIELKEYQAVMDSLQMKYKVYEEMLQNGSTAEKKLAEQNLKALTEQLGSFKEKANQDIQQRRNELTGDVLNEINIQISRYGKKHNYTAILGSTTDGSILYGDETNDITDDLLKELNELYITEKNAQTVDNKK